MKRFAFFIAAILLVLAIQPIVQATEPACCPLNCTQWCVILFAYDKETGDFLGWMDAKFAFEYIDDVCTFIYTYTNSEGCEVSNCGPYTCITTPLAYKFDSTMYVNGDFGFDHYFRGRANKRMTYMTGTIDTEDPLGLFYNFIAVPMAPAVE